MPHDMFIALVTFAFVSSITPGPNNLMLMASGANYGIWRSLPHMLGVGIGFTVMIVGVGTGLAQLFDSHPVSHAALKFVSVIYLLYLAYKIAIATPINDENKQGRPISFLQAAAFQWINPKAWAMALTAVTAYAPGTSIHAVCLVALVFGAVNLPSISAWTVMGQQMARVLTNRARLTAFNWTMAALLIGSLYPVVLG